MIASRSIESNAVSPAKIDLPDRDEARETGLIISPRLANKDESALYIIMLSDNLCGEWQPGIRAKRLDFVPC
jgi:hypothetical protein